MSSAAGSGRRGRHRRGRGGEIVPRLEGGCNPKFTPISTVPPEKIFDFVYLTDEKTIQYLNQHGRIVIMIRGPPGTRKEVLSDLICKIYPSSVICCAHDFFSTSPKKRDRFSVRESHKWCEEKLKDHCKRNAPIIILKNTHIRKYEFEEYLNIIRNHNYTLILAETPRKYKLSKEVLEMTNRKGLDTEYLGKRMFQWDECVPWFTGWFLNPTDSEWLFQKSQEVLSLLFEDEKEFKDSLSINGNINENFSQETVVFCIGSYCNLGRTDDGRACYLIGEVQDYCGKMSELRICSLIVKEKMLLAVVQLSSEQHNITLLGQESRNLPRKREPNDPLIDTMNSLRIQDDYGILNDTVGEIDKTNSKLTFESKEIQTEDSLLATYGFILLGRKRSLKSSPLFSDLTNTNGLYYYLSAEKPDKTVCIDGKVGYQVGDAWIVKMDSYHVCKSVFTGLY